MYFFSEKMKGIFSEKSMFHRLQELRDSYNDELLDKIVVFHGDSNTYIALSDTNQLSDYIEDGNIHLHEVVFGHYGQKIKIDIDASAEDLNSIDTEEIDFPDFLTANGISKIGQHIVYEVVTKTLDVFTELYSKYGHQLLLNDILITSSCSKEKKSYHVIINNYSVDNVDEAKYFASLVRERLPEMYKKYFDMQVYKSTQDFRIFGCSKADDPKRIKKIAGICELFQTNTEFTLEDTLIQQISDTEKLPRLLKITDVKPTDTLDGFEDDFVRTVVERKGYLKNFRLRTVKNNSYFFDRLNPSFCDICQEVHHNDNTLVLHANKTDDCLYVNEQCRHSVENKTILVDFLRNEPTVNDKKAEHLLSKNYEPIKTSFNKIKDIYSYSDDHMHDYAVKPTLCVSAQMKLGKTKALKKFIDTNFKGYKNIIFITFRKTFSTSIKETFSDFTMYDSLRGGISCRDAPRLIIQVESLHRIEIGEDPPDLVVLDEVESILDQFNSGLHKHFVQSCSVFQYLLGHSKHLICMDANLSNRTFKILELMRPNHPVSFHENKFKKAATDQYFVSFNINTWFGNLLKDLDENKKVVIPINSLSDAKMIHKFLLERYPDKSIKLYSSETPQAEKKLHFSDVNKYWLYDVLMYTPTCSAGVSFEVEHFDSLHGYFTDASCNVESCRQMMGRVRNISTNKHNILFVKSNIHGHVPITIQEIEREVINRRSVLFNELTSMNVPFEYNDSGQVIYYKSKYYYMFLYNMQFNNISKAFFSKTFVHQVINSGASVTKLTVDKEYIGTAKLILGRSKDVKKDIKYERAKGIAESPDITSSESEEIVTKMSAGDAVMEEVNSLQKYKMRQFYSYVHFVTPSIVAVYNNEEMKKIYVNLKELCKGTSYEDSLDKIREKEALRHNHMYTIKQVLEPELAEISDVQIDRFAYRYNAHRLIQLILQCFGFYTIFNPERLLIGSLINNIMINKETIDGSTGDIKLEFHCSTINVAALIKKFDGSETKVMKQLVKNFNGILKKYYGMEITFNQFFANIQPESSLCFQIGIRSTKKIPFIHCEFYSNDKEDDEDDQVDQDQVDQDGDKEDNQDSED